jgi:hypothetical protein
MAQWSLVKIQAKNSKDSLWNSWEKVGLTRVKICQWIRQSIFWPWASKRKLQRTIKKSYTNNSLRTFSGIQNNQLWNSREKRKNWSISKKIIKKRRTVSVEET